jgi:NAD(P)-dependent dehydrogenase (short-subunit alcohol dehydrogenase family)
MTAPRTALLDAFGYAGKRVLVVGGATGMGAAAAELALGAGAEVIVMDRAAVELEGVTAIPLNLAERESIDAAIADVSGEVNAVFSCAGVDEGTPGIERINFVGHRYLIDQLLAVDQIPRGGAICFISSTAGMGWERNFELLAEVLDIHDFDEAAKWMVDHGQAGYMGTKQAICAYVARESMSFLQRGIRINAICPGPTDTPLARANPDAWLGMGADYRQQIGVEPSQPIEQAYPLVFLCSDAASAISGITLVSDAGWGSAGLTGAFPPAEVMARLLFGRMSVEEFSEMMQALAPEA